jgi:hypothetical protein
VASGPWAALQPPLCREVAVDPVTPDQERLVALMMAASGLSREQVIEKWFSTGRFKATVGCGFGKKK